MTKELSGVLAYNIENNPILQKYNSLAERADIKMGMCILSPQTIAGILQLHDETTPFELMSIAESQPELLLLQNMVDPMNRHAFDARDKHEFASIQLRGTEMLSERVASFHVDEVAAVGRACVDITMESAVFPFLFPFGRGYYDGYIQFSNYVKMRICTLFSIYTLYKPYLLIMFQLK